MTDFVDYDVPDTDSIPAVAETDENGNPKQPAKAKVATPPPASPFDDDTEVPDEPAAATSTTWQQQTPVAPLDDYINGTVTPPVTGPAPHLGNALLIPDVDFETVARTLTGLGLFRVGITDDPKNPGALLGNGWPQKTTADPDLIADWFADHEPGHTPTGCYRAPTAEVRLAVHVGPEYVVVDVDFEEHVPAEWWPHFNDAPFQSSSANAHESRRGHYIFRKPHGYEYGNSDIHNPTTGALIGQIRANNAVFITAPSTHKHIADGRRYKWIRAGEITYLPTDLAEPLAANTVTFNGARITHDIATDADVEQFLAAHTGTSHPYLVRIQVEHLRGRITSRRGSVHQVLISTIANTLAFADSDLLNAKEALDALFDEFVDIRTNPTLNVTHKTPDECETEFNDAVRWALGKNTAKATANADVYAYETAVMAAKWAGITPPNPILPPEDYTDPHPAIPGADIGPATAMLHGRRNNDADNAALFMDQHPDAYGLRMGKNEKATQWVTWTGTTWHHGSDNDLLKVVNASVLDLYAQSAKEHYAAAERLTEQAATATTADEQKALQDNAKELHKHGAKLDAAATQLGNTARIKAILTQAHGLRALTTSDFDPQTLNPKSYPAANGKIVFTDDQGTLLPEPRLEPYTKADMILTTSTTDYDPTATSPLFDSYLDIFHPDLDERRRLQKAMALGLLDGNPAKVILLAPGKGDSGKTTLIEGLTAMHGPLGGTFNLAMFRDEEKSDPRNPALYNSLIRRFIATTETSSNQALHAALIKKLTGKDSLQARALHTNDIRVRVPAFVPMIGTNQIPKIPKMDGPTRDRFLVLPFTVSHRDETATALKDDPQALRALLRWCVEGLQLYLAEGFTPAEREAHRDQLTAAATLEGLILHLHLIKEPGAYAPIAKLQDALQHFKATHGGLAGWQRDGKAERIPERTEWTQGRKFQSNGYETKEKLSRLEADKWNDGKRAAAIIGYRLATPAEVQDREANTATND
ncbi:bifunctional DNA primase/polymerase [Gordonia terrae]